MVTLFTVRAHGRPMFVLVVLKNISNCVLSRYDLVYAIGYDGDAVAVAAAGGLYRAAVSINEILLLC